jgi:hypothetical protein
MEAQVVVAETTLVLEAMGPLAKEILEAVALEII